MTRIHPIKEPLTVRSNEYFEYLTRHFDEENGTRTFVAEMTLKEIWEKFMLPSHPSTRWYAETVPDYIDRIVEQRSMAALTKERTIWSNNPGFHEKVFGKLNAVYLMKKDILSGRGFVYPISVTAFDNGQFVVHPGGTRLMFADCYDAALDVIISDHTGEIEKKYPDLILKDVSELRYSFDNEPLSYLEVATDHRYCPSGFDKALNYDLYDEEGVMIESAVRRVTQIKEIADYNLKYDHHTYHKPASVSPPRRFDLSDDNTKIYVDGMLIHEKVDGYWSVSLDE